MGDPQVVEKEEGVGLTPQEPGAQHSVGVT